MRINHVSITLHEIVHSFESGLAPERKGRKNHPGVFPGCRLPPTIRAFLTLRIGTPPSINHQILITITTSISMTSFSRIVPPWIAFHVREPTGHKKGTPFILPEGTPRAPVPLYMWAPTYYITMLSVIKHKHSLFYFSVRLSLRPLILFHNAKHKYYRGREKNGKPIGG